MRARRKDGNHKSVGDHLRSKGWSVLDLAQHGASIDFAVAKEGWCALLEVKDGSLPPSERKLTDAEAKLRKNWDGPYILALSPEEAEAQLEFERWEAKQIA